jgi:Tfp pilus assembly protein PilN
MRNIESSPWLGSPELVEIKSVALDKQKVNEFTLVVQVKRAAPTTAPGAAPTTSPAKATPGAAPGKAAPAPAKGGQA